MRVAGKALEAGARLVSPTLIRWDCSGSCMEPREVVLHGRKLGDARDDLERAAYPIDPRRQRYQPVQASMSIEVKVRCRTCPKCARARAFLWRTRAEVEILCAQRTWFGTLTLRPEEHSRIYHECCVRYANGLHNVDFDSVSRAEQFHQRHAVIGKEITKYLKRVRKETGAKLRYIAVVESHKSGLPHYHLLVHEVVGKVLYANLSDQWKLGFSKWNLVKQDDELRSCGYVTKYLVKNAARVRASLYYGNPPELTRVVSETRTGQTTLPGPSDAKRRKDEEELCLIAAT